MSNIAFLLICLVFSFLLTFILIPIGIRLLYKFNLGKNIRSEGLIRKAEEFEKIHKKKQGTPSMGGLIMVVSLCIIIGVSIIVHLFEQQTMAWFGFSFSHSLWNREETYLAIFTFMSVATIGAIDDYMNVRGIGRTKGLSARIKMALLIILAFLGAYWFVFKLGYMHIYIPYIGNLTIGWFYMIIFLVVFISAANSVNITDGLDGLAGGLLLFQFLAYGAITYTRSLFILSAFCFIISGILLAFLWFNIYPAKLFMGDTGSLALGATLAVIACMTDTIVVFIIMSSIFILETCSVIIQILSKKFRNGKKIFKIAPYHHHLEAMGWKEETIVMRFWLIGMILAVIGVILAMRLPLL